MPNGYRPYAGLLVLLAWLPRAQGRAEDAAPPEILIEENFEAMLLERLSPPCALTGKSADSVIEVADHAGRGKVLHCVSKKDDLTPGLRWSLDPQKVAGKEIRCTFKALFPGTYTPNPEKNWERPRIVISATQPDDKVWYWGPPSPKPETKEWQTLSGKGKVPEGVKDFNVYMRVDRRIAECWFDDVLLEVNPGKDPPPDPKAGSQPRPLTPEEKAAEAPSRQLNDSGMLFSPEIAKGTLKALAAGLKGADAKKVLWIGAGMAGKDKPKDPPKAPKGWTFAMGPAELTAADVPALKLLQSLPEALAKERPGFVCVVGAPGRKDPAGPTEREDLTDVCRLCLRYGAAPIVVAPDAKDDDLTRSVALAVTQEQKLPAVDLKGDGFADRVTGMLLLLDQYVLGNAPAPRDAAGPTKTKPTGGRTDDDE